MGALRIELDVHSSNTASFPGPLLILRRTVFLHVHHSPLWQSSHLKLYKCSSFGPALNLCKKHSICWLRQKKKSSMTVNLSKTFSNLKKDQTVILMNSSLETVKWFIFDADIYFNDFNFHFTCPYVVQFIHLSTF